MMPVANNDADCPMDNWFAGRDKSLKPAMTRLWQKKAENLN